MELSIELIKEAKKAKTAEELFAMAVAEHMNLTAEEAAAYFAQLNPQTGELTDDELDNVSGGGCGQTEEKQACPRCGTMLKMVSYCDGIDPAIRSYILCYGCRSYGLWYNSYGWEELPEDRAKYLIGKTSGQ